MRLILTVLVSILISSSPAFSLTIDDLVERQGLYYEKFTNTPYSGAVVGKEQGKFRNGKKNGVWDYYFENGQLSATEVYKNGELNDETVGYTENGNVYFRGQYKEGLAVGEWLTYFYDSLQVSTKKTYRDDEENGLIYGYYTGGHLRYTAEVRQGKWNGLYTYYNENGTVIGKHVAELCPCRLFSFALLVVYAIGVKQSFNDVCLYAKVGVFWNGTKVL